MLTIKNIYKTYNSQLQKGIRTLCELPVKPKTTDIENLGEDFSLKNVSLSFKKKEITAVLGENGSGKSTLLKILAGMLTIDSGELTLNHVDYSYNANSLIPGHKKIKLVAQNFNLSPNLTIEQNILHALKEYTEPYKTEKCNELLEFLGLDHVKTSIPRLTSGGEQQRCAIAIALASDLDILLMDEPFSNMDVMHKQVFSRYLKPLAKRLNISIVFVTHDVQDAFSLADQMVVIQQGQVVQKDEPLAVYLHPISLYVAQITGITNLIKWSSGAKLHTSYTRPESLRYAEELKDSSLQSIEATIVRCIFMSNQYLIECKRKNSSILYFYHPTQLEIGLSIQLSFSTESLKAF